jgi:protease I
MSLFTITPTGAAVKIRQSDVRKSEPRSTEHDSPDELVLDNANEMSFPASDPIASSNITRVETAPDMSPADDDHQNSNAVEVNASSEKQSQAANAGNGKQLKDVKIAVLVTDGFEQVELLGPRAALEAAGATVEIISDKAFSVQGFEHLTKGIAVSVDKSFDDAQSGEYAAVLLPGGVANGDALRMLPQAQKFIQEVDRAKKPIASICHGGWLLISAGIAQSRTVTSWPSLQDDFRNAGGTWLDKDVVCDRNFVSSRKPSDIPVFNRAFISLLRKEAAEATREETACH